MEWNSGNDSESVRGVEGYMEWVTLQDIPRHTWYWVHPPCRRETHQQLQGPLNTPLLPTPPPCPFCASQYSTFDLAHEFMVARFRERAIEGLLRQGEEDRSVME